MKLRCLEGAYAGKILKIDSTGITVGRDEDCSLRFDEDGVSRRHARILIEGKKPVVIDLNSTNGVRVNGENIAGRKVLSEGDKVGIGTHVMLVTSDENANVAAAPAAKKLKGKPSKANGSPPSSSNGSSLPLILIVLVLACAAGYFVMTGRKPAAPPPTPTDIVETPAPPDFSPNPQPPPSRPPIGNPDLGLVDPTPPDETPKARTDTGVFFVNTNPRGASVQIDDQLVGRTPLFVPEMTGGTHSLRLSLDGYEDHTRAFYVPARDQLPTIDLAPSPGTCLITTDPPYATIMRGAQILGTSPMLLRDLGPGKHQIRVAEYGYGTVDQTVTISNFRADSVHVVLPPSTGTIAVTTLPPNASVLIDGVSKGISKAGADERGESEPFVISGLTRGPHNVEIEFDGRKSKSQRVVVSPGEAVSVLLAVWVPDVFVTTITGKTFTGMLRRKNELGDLVIQVSPRGAPVSLLNTQVTSTRSLTRDEAQALLDQLEDK